jgi:hypothetical protein
MHGDRRSDVSTVVSLASTICGIAMQTVRALLYSWKDYSVQALPWHYWENVGGYRCQYHQGLRELSLHGFRLSSTTRTLFPIEAPQRATHHSHTGRYAPLFTNIQDGQYAIWGRRQLDACSQVSRQATRYPETAAVYSYTVVMEHVIQHVLCRRLP